MPEAMVMTMAMAKILIVPVASAASISTRAAAPRLTLRLPRPGLLCPALPPLSRRHIPVLPRLTQVQQSRGPAIMASAASAETATNEENILEFVKNDTRRMLHVVYRVGDLDKTIKFYTECLGMKLLRRRDIPEEKYTNAFWVMVLKIPTS
ncbi:hypothetical protein KC19_8G052100 [Ceratodon purpureus]|uniref:VOC domain-containing protein n=1 Tax=Ceratodon purpureus TaxID=3225 RepID=A0A8T0GZ16_CERPU|nr:hypothetical protein KC19_8G052100 [Ceratodon purpureus]